MRCSAAVAEVVFQPAKQAGSTKVFFAGKGPGCYGCFSGGQATEEMCLPAKRAGCCRCFACTESLVVWRHFFADMND